MSFLEIKNIYVDYKGALILNDISLSVEREEFVCILGRNGVGKTTLLRSIMGLTPPQSGSIFLDSEDLAGKRPYYIAKKGISYVPQGKQIFPGLTVEENIKTGTFIARSKQTSKMEIFDYFPFLKNRLKNRAGELSGGQQQMLAIARGLVGDPDIMILDEPTEGIQPSIIKNIAEIIKNLSRDKKITFLLVEQNIDFAFKLSSRGYILEKGMVVSEGTVDELREDSIVKNYLTI